MAKFTIQQVIIIVIICVSDFNRNYETTVTVLLVIYVMFSMIIEQYLY